MPVATCIRALNPLLNAVAGALFAPGISPDGLTLVGFAIGVLALPFLALGWYGATLAAILLNRLLDGLDGALARRARANGRGRLSDIALIFLFTPWCRSALFWRIQLNNAWRAAGCCLPLSAPAAAFSLCRPGGRHQIANPGYAHKSLYYLGD